MPPKTSPRGPAVRPTPPSPGPDLSALDDGLRFLRLLWAVDHELQVVSKRMSGALGVTGPQRMVLRVVGAIPGIRAGEIAGLLHLDPGTLTGILDRLCGRGHLRRSGDPADGRRALFHVTAAGRRVGASAAGTIEEAVTRTLAGVPAASRHATTRFLTRLADELREAGERVGARRKTARRRRA